MDKKAINITLWVLAAILTVGALAAYLAKEEARKEYEKAKAEYEARPDMPIELTRRSALLGPGLVVSFKNSSDRHLAVVAQFINPTLNTEKIFRLDLPPDIPKEIGHAEGWTFSSGDSIKITHNDYKNIEFRVP